MMQLLENGATRWVIGPRSAAGIRVDLLFPWPQRNGTGRDGAVRPQVSEITPQNDVGNSSPLKQVALWL